METIRKILTHNIFTDEERHHISGLTQFVENIDKLKTTEDFFSKMEIAKLDIEINTSNAFPQSGSSPVRSVISNLKAYDSEDDRIENITQLLMDKIGFVSSPLQKLLNKFIPNERNYVYKNVSIDFNKDWKESFKSSLINNDLLKKIEVAMLESDLVTTLESSRKTKMKI